MTGFAKGCDKGMVQGEIGFCTRWDHGGAIRQGQLAGSGTRCDTNPGTRCDKV